MQDKASAILDSWKSQTIVQLCDGIQTLFDNAGDVFIDFASKTESAAVQTDFFDAQREIFLKGSDLRAPFQARLDSEASVLSAQPIERPGQETLNLLDKDEYELSVALETIAHNCEARNRENLYALRQRLSALSGGRKIRREQMPLNPQMVTSAFEREADKLDITKQVRLVLFTLFDRYVMQLLDDAYSEINRILAEAGVLPTIHYEVVRHITDEQGKSKRTRTPANEVAEVHSEFSDSISTVESTFAPPMQPNLPTTEESLRAISLLLSRQRKRLARKAQKDAPAHNEQGTDIPLRSEAAPIAAGDSPSSAGSTPTPTPAYGGRPAINQALDSIQATTAAAHPEMVTALNPTSDKMVVDKRLLLRIREALRRQREVIRNLAGRNNIGEREDNLIEIVGMLFEAILDEEKTPSSVKTLLSHLHTPFLKLAINDPAFLESPEHPARLLLENMLRVGTRWVDPENLRQGIFPTLQYCVQQIIEKPLSPDYEHLSEQLDKREQQLRQNQTLTEKRTLEAEKGQARLEHARDTATSATHTLLAEHRLSPPVRSFLETLFTDYLSLLLLRNQMNPEADACKKALGAAVNLVEANGQNNTEGMLRSAEELHLLISELLPHHEGRMSDFVAQLRTAPALESATPAVAPDPLTKKKAAIKEAKALELTPGSWFRWHNGEQPGGRRIKLLWSNPHTGRLLFVDQAGAKVAHMPADGVANDMASGKLELLTDSRRTGFFDGLLSAVRKRLETHNPEPLADE